jgi:hypothetical protein
MLPSKRFVLAVTMLFLLTAAILVVASGYLATTANEQEEQWMKSGHNFDPAHTHATTGASCVECHDSESFVRIKVKGEDPPAEDLPEHSEFGHTCTTCHDVENPTNILALQMTGDVTLPAYGDVVSAGTSAACVSCHNARRVNPPEHILTSSHPGPHHGPQGDMLSGTGAFTYGGTFGNSAHTAMVGCVDCHMGPDPAEGDRGHNEVGEHTFKMHWDGDTPANPNDDVLNVAGCQRCHPGLDTFDIPAKGDYDGDGVVEGVQTEVGGLLELLEAELPHDEEGEISLPAPDDIDPTDSTVVGQMMANYNYHLVLEDGSLGVHNTAYAVQMLRASIEDLTGTPLPGDTLAGSAFTANLPVTSDAIEKRLEQWETSPHHFDATDPEVLEELHESPVRASCLKCKNAEWFVKLQVNVPAEEPPAEDLAEGSEHGLTCKTCHNIDDATNILRLNLVGDYTLPAYGDVINAGVSKACVSCHNARRENPEEYVLTSSHGTHPGPQADMLAGKSAIDYGETLDSSTHIFAVEKKCVGCHMADTPDGPGHDLVGDHTFRMRSDNGTPDDPSDDIENVGACQSCHGGITTFDFPAREDFDRDGVVEGVQTEIDGMLAMLESVLPKDDEGNIAIVDETPPEERMAHYNYTLVADDGSRGIHNLRYAVDVLRTTYKALTGKEMGPELPPEGAENVFFATLSPGLNMISLPLDPPTPYTARSLAEELSATVVIKYDEVLGRFMGFAPAHPGDGFPIEGAKGYIVNVPEGGTFAFTGAAWTNEPTAEAAPPSQNSNAWAFMVSGSLLDGEMMSVSDGGYTVTVRNLRTDAVVATEQIGNSGYFTAAWADLNRKAVIKAGDRLEVTVMDAGGGVVSGPFTHEVGLDEIRDAVASIRLRLGEIIPARSVLLQNYPNPFNPETWIPYHLKNADSVSIRIYSSAGQLIRTLDIGYRDAGVYVSRSKAAYWDGKNEAGEEVASGIYFYSIKAGDFSATRKMVVKK